MFKPARASHFSISRKVLIGFSVALSMVVIIGVISHRSTMAFMQNAARLSLARQTVEKQERLLRALLESESSARGFVLTGDDKLVAEYQAARQASLVIHQELLQTVSSNRENVETLRRLSERMQAHFAQLQRGIEIRQSGDVPASLAYFSEVTGAATLKEIQRTLDAIGAKEQFFLTRDAAASKQLGELTSTILFGGSAFTFLLLMIATVLILRDISARKRVEDQIDEERNLLHSVMDAMPDFVHVKDRQGRYIIDNHAHRAFLGVKDFSSVEGKTVYDFFPADLAEPNAREDEGVMKTGESIRNREEAILEEDGGTRWYSVNKVPLRDRDNDIVGIVVVTSDITERKLAEEALRLTAAQLERSNRELQDFASVASHDLQEPLRKILAFSDRLQIKCGAALGENGRDYLERVMNAARRMQTLIQDLLTLARVTSRAQPFVAVDMTEVVRGVVSDLEIRIEQSGGSVKVEDLPVIDADPMQMRQLFLNLINNALKFAKAEVPPEVKVRANVRTALDGELPGASEGEEICEIEVQDNGIGFDERFCERIFQVFQRLHGRTEYEGTGIGLAVVRKIVDRHGGQIVARSIEGSGSTFIVTLPCKQRMRDGNEEAR